jgi:hypothetical protein
LNYEKEGPVEINVCHNDPHGISSLPSHLTDHPIHSLYLSKAPSSKSYPSLDKYVILE